MSQLAFQPRVADEAVGARPGAAIAGLGLALPERVVANAAIARRLGVDEEWIERRSGTRVRHMVADGERLSDLAAAAGRAALADGGVEAGALDMVIVATTSPDEMSPHAATFVTGALGAGRAGAIDVSAACVGFLSALALAVSTIEAGRAANVLVVGADALSRFLDADDRQSAMLFGDGAGAAVVSATSGPSLIGPVLMRSDPDGGDLISLRRDEALIRMDGPRVYRRAVDVMADVTREAADAAGVALDEIDLFVYHQANSRILRAVGARLGLDPARVVDYIDRYANTSAASLPIALAAAARDGRLWPGARVLLAAFGAGLVWGGVVVEWR
jgi:3-oxoacyl-[acyl-carrier-protein] synthase-3